jgi:integrase
MRKISALRRNGKVVGYSVYLGLDGNGKLQRRFFRDQDDAERFLIEQNKTSLPLGELMDRKAEILFNLERLNGVGGSLTDVVSYYLNHGVPKETTRLVEVVERFSSEKKQVGRSQHYDRSMKYYLGRFVKHVGPDKKIGDITRREITDYVYGTNKDVGPVTKKNILTNLSVLFNFAVREDYLEINPVEKITRPTIPFTKPHVLSPSDFEKLLRRCQKKKWFDRLTVFVLVGFCGIRVEEVSRLKWSNINLKRNIVEVPASVAKKASFRNNLIPANAREWLKLVEDRRRTGPIIGPNWRNLLRSTVRFSHIDYRQNCIRHSFCSYALASGFSLADVIACMGHGGSSSMVFTHYRNVVSKEEGERWFALRP